MLLSVINISALVAMTGLMSSLYWPGYSSPHNGIESGPGRHLLLRICFIAAGLYLVSILATFFTDNIILGWTQAELINLVLVPVFCIYAYRDRGDSPANSKIILLVLGLAVILFHSMGSHAATQPGLIPLISQVIHLLAVSMFIGLMTLAILSYRKGMTAAVQPNQGHRSGFNSRLAGSLVILLVIIILSGSILSIANVHSTAVLDGTQYGLLLKLKIGLVAILTIFLLFEIVWKLPSVPVEVVTPEAVPLRRGSCSRGTIALLILVTIPLAGMLTSLPSPDTAPFLNPQRWQLHAGSYEIDIDMRPVAGSINHARFEIYLPEALMQSPATQLGFNLYMPGSQTGIFDAEALQVSQNSYQGEAMFPHPGSWRLELDISRPESALLQSSIDFIIPAQPLVRDLRTYLSLSAITYNRANLLTFMIGLLLMGLYTLIIIYGRKDTVSRWTMITATLGIGLGIYMVMSVALVKTYPSTYLKNPVSYSVAAINSGENSYMNSCADCHGQSGLGDGPWAIDNRGLIQDLGSPHMDVHTDGEIYWWITHGIPSLDMPPAGEEITEQDRWSIIQFVRSLRHGIPPDS